MFWNIILLVVFVTWIILLLKNKKTLLSLPYLLMIFITPIYNILDQKMFVDIFGCGCVPYTQTNMLNIDFNANNLRIVVYSIVAILISILGVVLSKKIDNRKNKIVYVGAVIIFNFLLALQICRLYTWL